MKTASGSLVQYLHILTPEYSSSFKCNHLFLQAITSFIVICQTFFPGHMAGSLFHKGHLSKCIYVSFSWEPYHSLDSQQWSLRPINNCLATIFMGAVCIHILFHPLPTFFWDTGRSIPTLGGSE